MDKIRRRKWAEIRCQCNRRSGLLEGYQGVLHVRRLVRESKQGVVYDLPRYERKMLDIPSATAKCTQGSRNWICHADIKARAGNLQRGPDRHRVPSSGHIFALEKAVPEVGEVERDLI